MSEELIKELFLMIAFRAMETGKEIRLEKGTTTSTSKVLGGTFADSIKDYDSLSMLISQTTGDETEDEEEAIHELGI